MDKATLKKKKVIIVGGGMSGMTAGIYLLDNGFDVEIYEKHSIPGGECTGWVREGQYIDGCAHWLIGTNPGSCLYPIWEHIGAFENTHLYDNDNLSTYYFADGSVASLHSDITTLEKELIALSPKDKKQIRSFIRTIEAYTHVVIPTKKPIEAMNIFELIAMGIKCLPFFGPYLKYRRMSVEEYAKKFKDKRIGDMLVRFMGGDYNMHSLFYVLQGFCTRDAGVPEGGSLKMAMRVANRFKSLGGVIHVASPVKKIVLDKSLVKGIELENGTFVEADYVVSSADAHFTFNKLLPDLKMPKFFKERFSKPADYQLRSAFQVSLQANCPMDDFPRMCDFEIPEEIVGKDKITSFVIRNHAFDKSLSRNHKALLTILLPTYEETYDYLTSLSKEEYASLKKGVGERFRKITAERLGIKEEDLVLLDVTSPLTYTHYANAYKGAYMSFLTTKKSKGLMVGCRVKGVRNLLLSGQWLMPPGGLPVALFTGKHAAYNICQLERKRFIDKEETRVKGALKTKIA